VIGLFIQQSVLAQNNEELRRNKLHSEKNRGYCGDGIKRAAGNLFQDLRSNPTTAGCDFRHAVYFSQGPVGNGSISGEELAEVWKQFASGDSEVFSRMFLNMAANTEISMHELYYGTEIRRRHSENFLVGFDRLLILAKECDTDNIILDSLVYSAHGLLNNRMRELHPEIKFKLITGTNSEKYLERIINQDSDLAT
jgi:hypothetical protein